MLQYKPFGLRFKSQSMHIQTDLGSVERYLILQPNYTKVLSNVITLQQLSDSNEELVLNTIFELVKSSISS